MISSKGRFDQFHKNKHEDGAAMIVVVCVLMVVMIICLTLIVGAYQTMSTVNDGLGDVTSYQQAKSFSDVLKKRIICSDELVVPSSPDNLAAYIQQFAGDESNLFEPGTTTEIEGGPIQEFQAKNIGDGYSNLRLVLNKQRVRAGESLLFVTVMAEKDDKVVSSVTAGYRVLTSTTPDPMDSTKEIKKVKLAFRAYY